MVITSQSAPARAGLVTADGSKRQASTSRLARLLRAGLVVLGAFVLVGSVAAEASAKKSLTDRQARARYEKGKQAYESGDYLAAATHFELAWKHFDDPSLLWNYGRALERGGEQVSARDAYRELLAIDGVNSKLRGKVQAALDALEVKLAADSEGPAIVTPPDTTVTPPSDSVPRGDGWAAVAPIEHGSGGDLGSWLLIGGGGLVAVVGGVLVGVGQGKHDDVADHQERADAGLVDSLTRREAIELRDDGSTFKTAGWVAVGLGVAAVTTGAILLATSDDDSASGVHVGASVGSSGGGMVLSGSF